LHKTYILNSKQSLQFFSSYRTGLLFWLLLIITAWAYWDGLESIFILDDEPNLESLSSIKGKNYLEEIGLYLYEGNAGTLKRPISLFTFALQAHQWPNNPFAFKYINLMIHLLNACLIFWLILLITRLLDLSEQHSRLLALLTTAVWVLNPTQISTVLYVVQRMAQLSVLFTLLGLLAYVLGRTQLHFKQLKSGYLWICLGVSLATMLALFSKENGVLLLLYILVLEFTLFNRLPKPAYWQIWRSLFLYLPLLGLIVYFIFKFDVFLNGYTVRDFTLSERLLTESRILLEYIWKIIIPNPQVLNLFHDDYIISKNLLDPPITLVSVIILLTAFALAIFLRHRQPVFSFAVLWFLAGHSIESSFIPLVLYFEHRNYLAMLGILFALVYGTVHILMMQKSFLRRLGVFFILGWLFLQMSLTWSEAKLWHNPLLQAVIWAKQKPMSRYAQSHAASVFIILGKYPQAVQYYQQMLHNFPQDTGPYALWLSVACFDSQVDLPEKQTMLQHFATAKGDIGAISGFRVLLEEHLDKGCDPQFPVELIGESLEKITQNPDLYPHYKADFYNLYARFIASQREYNKAIETADKSLQMESNINIKMFRLNWLIQADRLPEAMAYISQLRKEFNLVTLSLYTKHLDILRRYIQNIYKIRSPDKSSSS